ncbi:putative C2 domain, phosphoribosyltransferase, C2 domain superfamily [Helianthus annuus]|nr:putative C2 domain, phosphoribosyltransferase, C2 domain superfamily [Helianthus annuus]
MNLKLGVDVAGAHNLLPKDGHGSSSAYVELYFDGQKYRTTVKEKDLDPVWDESFYFNISDPSILPSLTLDAFVYNNVKGTNSRSFLGKVSITGTSFVPYSDAVVLHYPLEKRGIFSRVRGELGLKVYITDDPTIKSSDPVVNTAVKKSEQRHTFHHLPHQTQAPANTAVPAAPPPMMRYGYEQIKPNPPPPPPKLVRMYSESSSQPVDYALKETSPYLGGGRVVGGRAVQIVAARLGRAEPPLRKEVVEYMSDVDSHLWSMRRSKANFFRLMMIFAPVFAVSKWFNDICMWRNPITTVLVHVLFIMLVCFPELILPTVFLYMFLIGIWNFRYRPRYPPHMNTKISQAEGVHPDELDEEFDTFPTSRNPDLVRMRYDRLRSVAGRIQTVVGDIATQGERMQSLLSWRDPRATAIFVTFCLVAAIVLYVTPFQAIAGLIGLYMMRHPRFRHRLPSVPINFFRRLPARTDSML